MRALLAMVRVAIAALVLTALGLGTVSAEGSIGLDEVMDQLKADRKLIAEIKTELTKQTLKAEDVICIGSRFGSHWTHLGGARSIPFNCKIGTRTLDIEGDLHLYDKKGKELNFDDDTTPERAVSYKETNLKWSWN